MLVRPGTDEYHEYYHRYVKLVPDGDIVSQCATQRDEIEKLLGGIAPDLETYRYEEGKWSAKEVIGHLIDTERVFAYRTIVFARNDSTPQAGFEQDDWVRETDFDSQKMSDLTSQFLVNRNAYLWMLQSLDDGVWTRSGTASDCQFTVRSIPYIVVGHAIHHMDVLRERYL